MLRFQNHMPRRKYPAMADSTLESSIANLQLTPSISKINTRTSPAGVNALAKNRILLQNLSTDGKVSLTFQGDTSDVTVSANITTNDFSALAQAINTVLYKELGILALYLRRNILELNVDRLHRIQLVNFSHSNNGLLEIIYNAGDCEEELVILSNPKPNPLENSDVASHRQQRFL